MKSITIRDIRLRWPAAEHLLQTEHELVITRDGQPVAKLVRLAVAPPVRSRFDPAQHARWQAAVFGAGNTVRWVDQSIRADREDRPLRKK
jgi:antitoxin (DNA-binding transcriptional repressor) of toxin-antitoxin stability system